MKRLWTMPTTNPINAVPDGYDGPRCTWKYKLNFDDSLGRPVTCGLPAWEEAGQPEPRCLLHARRKPEGFYELLLELIEAGADISEARLEYLDLPGLDVSGMGAEGLLCNGANLRGANFSEAGISFVTFDGADLTGACFEKAMGMHTEFNGACLRDANLRDVDIEFAEFRGADLRGADLTNANFEQAWVNGCHPPPEQWQVKHLSRYELFPDDDNEIWDEISWSHLK